MFQEWTAIYIDDDPDFCRQAEEQLNSAIIADDDQHLLRESRESYEEYEALRDRYRKEITG